MTRSTMLAEALSIPGVAARALARNDDLVAGLAAAIRAFAPQSVATVARGSSDNAAEYAGRLIAQETGLLTASLPPSLVTLEHAPLRLARMLVVAFSQSGRSPDLVEPLSQARSSGALTLAVVNDEESPLAQSAELVLPVDAGDERAVAATKSYVLTLLQTARLVAAWAEHSELARALATSPKLLEAATATDWGETVALLQPLERMFVVGRGLGTATARETALKLKEICCLHAEAMSGAEIMHGPKALIDESEPVIFLAPPDATRDAQKQAANALAEIGARLIVVGSPIEVAATTIALPQSAHPALNPLITITAIYPLAENLARVRDLSPDTPRHLRKVTHTV